MDKKDIKPGIVYRNKKSGALGVLFVGYDYGCLSEEEVGIIYRGDDQHPTMPAFAGTDPEDWEEYELREEDMLTKNHVREICKVGKGEDCCRYLTIESGKFSCERIKGDTTLAWTIDERVRQKTIGARAINCGGRYGSVGIENALK